MELQSNNHIAIIGTGRVAGHLARALHDAGFAIQQVYGRNLSKAAELASSINAIVVDRVEDISPDTSICILAVSDDAIYPVSKNLPSLDGVVVHTSGFRSINEIDEKHTRKGVLYPLQTFSAEREADFASIPFFIEASNDQDMNLLFSLASKLSKTVVVSSLSERQQLHLSAVFVSNFTNALYAVGKELLLEKQLDFSLLYPLIVETAQKATVIDPQLGQTGPARRNDRGTIQKHLHMLEKHAEAAVIYRLITEKILNTYHKANNE